MKSFNSFIIESEDTQATIKIAAIEVIWNSTSKDFDKLVASKDWKNAGKHTGIIIGKIIAIAAIIMVGEPKMGEPKKEITEQNVFSDSYIKKIKNTIEKVDKKFDEFHKKGITEIIVDKKLIQNKYNSEFNGDDLDIPFEELFIDIVKPKGFKNSIRTIKTIHKFNKKLIIHNILRNKGNI